MRLLALDIGSGTQDLLLLDTSTNVENCLKMILPSPTRLVAQQIDQATARRRPLFLHGVNMGGGPCTGALKAHLKAGLAAYATPEAACTFDDDLEAVQRMGVILVAHEEAPRGPRVKSVELQDLDLKAIRKALGAFGIPADFEALAVAVLDHGAAPPGMSDRLFRFQHLKRVAEEGRGLISFAYLSAELPPYLTRMKAVAQTAGSGRPLLLLDTGPAAALGMLEDREVARHRHRLLVNLGNSHALAFHLEDGEICGLFEHHTGGLDGPALDSFLRRLLAGNLTQEEVYQDGGHGALVFRGTTEEPFLAATGPRRALMNSSRFPHYFAAPHGDMMLTGCFGLVRAFAERFPEYHEEIEATLGR